MDRMSLTLTPSLASLIPEADLARAVRLAFDTLLSILKDKAATVRDKRMAATVVLRLASTRTSPGVGGRKPGVNHPSAQTTSPTPTPAGVACSSCSELEHVPTPRTTEDAPLIVLGAPT